MTQAPDTDNGYVRLANGILQALALTDLTGAERRVLDVIFFKTYGFRKKTDKISLTQFEEFTGLPRRTITRSIDSLEKRNIIGTDTSLFITQYGFNKQISEWKNKICAAPNRDKTVPSKEKGSAKPKKKKLGTKKSLPKTRDIPGKQLGTPTSHTTDNITTGKHTTTIDDVIPSSDESADALTPAQYAELFFGKDKVVMMREVGFFLKRGSDLPVIRDQFSRFISYWTERTPGGKKQRWQTEKTFEVRRRLTTWFDRTEKSNKHSKNIRAI